MVHTLSCCITIAGSSTPASRDSLSVITLTFSASSASVNTTDSYKINGLGEQHKANSTIHTRRHSHQANNNDGDIAVLAVTEVICLEVFLHYCECL